MINIANILGVKYLNAFVTLWSERNFTDEVDYNIYTSKRVFANLKTLGVIIDKLDCDKIKRSEQIQKLSNDDLIIIGMDTFYVPWNPVFKNFHGPHYFFAIKESKNSIICYDPVYNEKNLKMQSDEFLSFAFEVSHIYKTDVNPPEYKITLEAKNVLTSHPKTRKKLVTEIQKCKNGNKINFIPIIKYVTAMINNRYMFQNYFNNIITCSHKKHFNETYLLRWEGVRNGLYKARIINDNNKIIDEVSELFLNLMNEEIAIAKELLKIEKKLDDDFT